MAKGVIGEGIRDYVYDQIKRREEILKNKGTEPQWQKLYTAKTAWVRLSSSVDVNNDGGKSALKNILTARRIKGDSGVNESYNKSSSLGIRPIPGLTNVSIQSINRFGTLRNAVVEFKVYDVERLSELEQLYMRPGFSILLEWGHSVYKTKSGVSSSTPYIKKFYSSGTKASEVEKAIKKYQRQTEGNYAGLFGYVKNFQWSFNQDGSYNCRVEIISKGELLESLQYSVYGKLGAATNSDINADKNRSSLHAVMHALRDYAYLTRAEKQSAFPLSLAGGYSTAVNWITLQKVASKWDHRSFGPFYVDEETAGEADAETTYLSYVRMGAFLEILNDLALAKDQTGQPISRFNTKIVSVYTSYINHYSGHPGRAMIMNNYVGLAPTRNTAFIDEFGDGLYIPRARTAPSFLRNIGADYWWPDTQFKNDINMIWVNVDYILEELNNVIDSRTGDANVFDLLKNILAGIEGAFGNINEFDIAYNEEDNYHYIVDRKHRGFGKSYKGIRVSGKSTTVSNLSITSKLSPQLGTLIAISAQNSRKVTDVGLEAENLFKWNEGLQDRIITDRITVDEVTDDNSPDGALETAKTKLRKARRKLELKRVYIPEEFDSLLPENRIITNTGLREELKTKKRPAPGIIPFELNITLDGISGLRIGEVFDIEDEYIFPERYRGEIAFIITGLEHTVQNNKWLTIVKAQTITK